MFDSRKAKAELAGWREFSADIRSAGYWVARDIGLGREAFRARAFVIALAACLFFMSKRVVRFCRNML